MSGLELRLPAHRAFWHWMSLLMLALALPSLQGLSLIHI